MATQNGNPTDQQETREKKKKKKSAFDEIRSAKKIYDKTKQYVQYAQWLANPAILVPILILAAVLALMFSTSGGSALISGGDSPTDTPPTGSTPSKSIPGLTLILTGPDSIANSQNLLYTVEVRYSRTTPPLSSLVIYNIFPSNTSFVEASGAFTLDGNKIEWPMNNNANIFTFTLKPLVEDTIIVNNVYARLISGSSAGAVTTTDTCGGKYDLAANPLGANFGDPLCEFVDPTMLYTLLQQTDPPNADFWYVCALLESSRNPNAYAGHAAVGTPDPAGAWGLFQMGRGLNGPLDRGDVDWQTQTTNAISYSKKLKSLKEYWQCARHEDYDGVL